MASSVQFVWAKMRKFSAWPGKVCFDAPENIPKPRNHEDLNCIYFYGTHNYRWISSDKIWNYFEKKDEYSGKNQRKTFQTAIKEIEGEIEGENEEMRSMAQSKYKLGCFPTTIKDWKICDILDTFDEHKEQLERLFHQRKYQFDRFNEGNGYDFLTVLWKTVTPEQQQAMYSRILKNCVQDEKKYFQNPRHENLFWSILLPEWVIGICLKTYKCNKQELLDQIKKEDMDDLNDSFEY